MEKKAMYDSLLEQLEEDWHSDEDLEYNNYIAIKEWLRSKE